MAPVKKLRRKCLQLNVQSVKEDTPSVSRSGEEEEDYEGNETTEMRRHDPEVFLIHNGSDADGFEVNGVSAAMRRNVNKFADRYGLDDSLRSKLTSSSDDAVGRVVCQDLSSRVRNHNGYVHKMLLTAGQALEYERHGGNEDCKEKGEGAEDDCRGAAWDDEDKDDVHGGHAALQEEEEEEGPWHDEKAEQRYDEGHHEAYDNDEEGWHGDRDENYVSWYDDAGWHSRDW